MVLFFLVICVVCFQCYFSMTRSLSVLSDSAPTSLICPTHMQYASMHKFILFICPSHAQHYSDIPNDPPFAGWARNFSDRATYSLTRITSKEGRQLALRLFFVACCILGTRVRHAVWTSHMPISKYLIQILARNNMRPALTRV